METSRRMLMQRSLTMRSDFWRPLSKGQERLKVQNYGTRLQQLKTFPESLESSVWMLDEMQ